MSWFRRLMGEIEVCETCEVLKQQLAYSQQQNQYLLDKLLNPIQSTEIKVVEDEETKPLVPKHVPWSVKRQMLEEEDRQRAKVIAENLRKNKEDIAKLEKDLKLEPSPQMVKNA